MQCGWGSTNLTIALQLLLRVALEEPRNQRFILLSESGVPLYPAVTIHQARGLHGGRFASALLKR